MLLPVEDEETVADSISHVGGPNKLVGGRGSRRRGVV